MKDRAARGYDRIAVLPDFNLVLNRRFHVLRIMTSGSDILRTVQHATVLVDELEVFGNEPVKCCRVLALYSGCPLVFDRQDFSSYRFEVGFTFSARPRIH